MKLKFIFCIFLSIFLLSCEKDEPQQNVSSYILTINAGEINLEDLSVDINIKAEIESGSDISGSFKILYGSSKSELDKSIVIESYTYFGDYSDESYNLKLLNEEKMYVQVVFNSEIIDIKSNIIVVELEDLSTDDAVDLGLSVLWAKCELGAENPWEHGMPFVWGDPSGLKGYKCDVSLCGGEIPLTEISGTKYDIANVKLGNGWRLPTIEEIEELKRLTKGEDGSLRGNKGVYLSAKNGNELFIPSYYDHYNIKYYWSGTLDESSNYAYSYGVNYYSNYYSSDFETIKRVRNEWCYVRPVRDRDYVTSVSPSNKVSFDNASGYIKNYAYIDLKMPSKIKWATCNIGATSTIESGEYFSWGEISPKLSYEPENSLLYNNELFIEQDIKGSPKFDAATANWGGSWRMPTLSEFEELLNNCICSWIKQGKHKGYCITSKHNGNYLFLPLTGYFYGSSLSWSDSYGRYWSSECGNDDDYAYDLAFDSSDIYIAYSSRYYGYPIRPVSD